MSDRLFPTITGAHWRVSIARARAQKNKLAEQIKTFLGERGPAHGSMTGVSDSVDGHAALSPNLSKAKSPESY